MCKFEKRPSIGKIFEQADTEVDMDYRITDALDGCTVLDFLRRELGMSTAMIKHLKFKSGGITVGGEHVTVRHVLHVGEVLMLATEDSETSDKLLSVDLGLHIAYEDSDVAVPDKPPYMPTHPSHGHYDDTVANALAFRYGAESVPYVFRPVNRLDRNTSGLLLIARNRPSAGFLFEQMKCGGIKKKYIAILRGTLPCDSGVIDTYMRRTVESIIVREVCDEHGGGDRAITEYEVICRSETHTMVCAVPVTGRTHQLRVHFAHLGAPIEGDDLYGEASSLIGRHALHSFYLSFPKRDGERVSVYAPLHEDMAALAEAVFGEALEGIPDKYKIITEKEKLNETQQEKG